LKNNFSQVVEAGANLVDNETLGSNAAGMGKKKIEKKFSQVV
jgi:hypothetical protein